MINQSKTPKTRQSVNKSMGRTKSRTKTRTNRRTKRMSKTRSSTIKQCSNSRLKRPKKNKSTPTIPPRTSSSPGRSCKTRFVMGTSSKKRSLPSRSCASCKTLLQISWKWKSEANTSSLTTISLLITTSTFTGSTSFFNCSTSKGLQRIHRTPSLG